ncbi:MAG: ATP-binding protein [Candidatus Marinimicrobia bacterium]|nr:ATP-binding protein [Candidatus Neomarinimicrobiota bacterium]
MLTQRIIPRYILISLEEALADTPVVIIHGPRQCGKSTLAQIVAAKHGHQYLSFDDDNLLRAAREDPVGFCTELPIWVVLDEIQRVPELFTSIKTLVDQNRQPGRFILTGSANIMLIPKLADSLAGRMEVIRLAPLTQVEIEQSGLKTSFIEQLFSGSFSMRPSKRLGDDLIDRLLAGGFPPVLTRSSFKRQRTWQLQYIDALTLRDIKELSNIHSLEAIPELLQAVAGQTACLVNVSKLAGFFERSRPTIKAYLTLLEQIFLIEMLPAWHNNRLKRLVKTPKIHITDTGLAGALLGVDKMKLKKDRTLYGQILESFVNQELRRQSYWADSTFRFFHYRDKDKVEVDFVIEKNGKALCGVEVKASSSVNRTDFKGLRRLRTSHDDFICGVVLYDGDKVLPFGDQFYAVPFNELW